MNFSEQIKQSNTDEWYTPKECVELIVKYLERGGWKHILCPFDKPESNFVKVLTDRGFDVTYSHIETGTDFFDINNLDEYDAVISNPPFSKRQAILERLFKADIPFALILNFNGLFDSTERWKLFRDNKFELLIPRGRMHFFNETCDGNSPNFQSVYVCHGILDKQIEFAEMEEISGQLSIFDFIESEMIE